MKLFLYLSTLLLVLTMGEARAFDEGGAGTKGGGEAAEMDFKKRRDEFREGFLKHPNGVSSMKLSAEDQNFELADYKRDMLRWTSGEKNSTDGVRIEFITQQQNHQLPVGERVEVRKIQKTCVSFPKRPLIRCITEKYWATPKKERTALVIHEYHVLAGYEVISATYPEESDYHLTNGVTSFLVSYSSDTDYRFSLKASSEWSRPVQGDLHPLSSLAKGTVLRFLEQFIFPANERKVSFRGDNRNIALGSKGNWTGSYYFCALTVPENQISSQNRLIKKGDFFEVLGGKLEVDCSLNNHGNKVCTYYEIVNLGKVGSNKNVFSISCEIYQYSGRLTSAAFFYNPQSPHPTYVPYDSEEGFGQKIEIYSLPAYQEF